MNNKYQEAYSYIKHYCELDDDFLKWPIAERSIKILQELVDKETPQEIKRRYEDTIYETTEMCFVCPHCGEDVYYDDQKYCHECGQKLDWSDE